MSWKHVNNSLDFCTPVCSGLLYYWVMLTVPCRVHLPPRISYINYFHIALCLLHSFLGWWRCEPTVTSIQTTWAWPDLKVRCGKVRIHLWVRDMDGLWSSRHCLFASSCKSACLSIFWRRNCHGQALAAVILADRAEWTFSKLIGP